MGELIVRKKKRYNVSLPIRVLSPFESLSEDPHNSSNDKGSAERSMTQNISSKGCYFLLTHGLPLGSTIDLEIEIPALQPIPNGLKLYCRAKVVRVHEAHEQGKIGIACMIDEYRLSRVRKNRTKAHAA